MKYKVLTQALGLMEGRLDSLCIPTRFLYRCQHLFTSVGFVAPVRLVRFGWSAIGSLVGVEVECGKKGVVGVVWKACFGFHATCVG